MPQTLKATKNVFDIIENIGPDNLRDTLKIKLRRAKDVFISVAFITQSGLDEIIQSLRQAASQGKVRLITGLYQGFTEPKALETLINIQNESAGNFLVHLSKKPQFHRKLYILSNNTKTTAIIGSSNLTKDGLISDGELNLIISLPKNSPSIKNLDEIIKKDWENDSVLLSIEQINRYKESKSAITQKFFNKIQLKRILGESSTSKKIKSIHTQQNSYWMDYVDARVKKETEKIISEITNWDEKGFDWLSMSGNHPYKIRDYVFLFDMVEKRLTFIEIKDIAQTKVATPDGRNFIAYKPVRKYKIKRLTKNLWGKLEEENIRKKNIKRRRRLNEVIVEKLSDILRGKRK